METSFEECDKRIHLQPSNSSSHRSPILLVHGAFAARLDFFLDSLATMGRSAVALDLRGTTRRA
jgi:hypothetical protein